MKFLAAVSIVKFFMSLMAWWREPSPISERQRKALSVLKKQLDKLRKGKAISLDEIHLNLIDGFGSKGAEWIGSSDIQVASKVDGGVQFILDRIKISNALRNAGDIGVYEDRRESMLLFGSIWKGSALYALLMVIAPVMLLPITFYCFFHSDRISHGLGLATSAVMWWVFILCFREMRKCDAVVRFKERYPIKLV